MSPEERAIEALAEALHPEYWDDPWDEADEGEMATDRYSAAAIWSRIDRDALRAALLADLRREVEELMTHVNRAAVLRLLGDPRRP